MATSQRLFGLVPEPWTPYFQGCSAELAAVERFLAAREGWHPARGKIFLPLSLLEPQEVSVCLIGQDPYPVKYVPTGLPFAVSPKTDRSHWPKSLTMIDDELCCDL